MECKLIDGQEMCHIAKFDFELFTKVTATECKCWCFLLSYMSYMVTAVKNWTNIWKIVAVKNWTNVWKNNGDTFDTCVSARIRQRKYFKEDKAINIGGMFPSMINIEPNRAQFPMTRNASYSRFCCLYWNKPLIPSCAVSK